MAGRQVALAACTAAAVLVAGGCGATPRAAQLPAAGCAGTSSPKAAAGQPGQPVPGTPWPERRIWPRAGALAQANVVVDPAARAAYVLVPRTSGPPRGPYLLECVNLRTGHVTKGATFGVPDIALASGYLWIYGRAGQRAAPVLIQLDPRTLRVVRSVHLPGTIASAFPAVHLTAGPGRSVWIGSVRLGTGSVLLRVDARTGKVLTTVGLPAGLIASDLAADPAGQHLYLSAAHTVGGDAVEGNVVLEYNADSGQLIADASHGIVTYAVAGSALTAVPGSVWVSFRTGMLGLTLHLRQGDLALIAPTGKNVALSPATGLFHWAMYAVTSYGSGALWLANQEGTVACLDPATGKPRATEKLSADLLIFQLLAADPASHVLYAADSRGVVAITPPAACWGG